MVALRLLENEEVSQDSHNQVFFTTYSQTALFISATDGDARIFALHLMPLHDSNPHQSSCTRLGHLKDTPLTEL